MRNSIEKRIMQQMLEALLPGHTLTDRFSVLGTRESVESLNRDDMLDFYKKNYIPSRMTLVVTGAMDKYDDVIAMENRIVEVFDDMKSIASNGPKVLWEAYPQGFRTAVIAEPDAPFETLYLYVAQSAQTIVDTKERRMYEISLQLVYEVLSVRFQRIAEQAGAPIAWGAASSDILANIVELSWIQVVPTPSGVESSKRQTLLSQAVTTLEQEFRRIMENGFTEAELEVAKRNVLKQYRDAADASTTPESLAEQLILSIATRSVTSSPKTDLELATDLLGDLSVETVHQTFVEKWSTEDISLIYVTIGQDTTEESLKKLYISSQASAIPAVDAANSNVNDETLSDFAYTNDCFGPSSGHVVYDVTVDDLGIRQVVLSNNARLSLKKTSFEENRIYISARFGSGRLGMPPNATGLDDLTETLINHGGLGLHSQASLDTIFAESSVGLEMNVEDGGFVFKGSTTPEDLNLQLLLLCAYLSDPGYRPSAYQLFQNEIGPYISELQYTLKGPYEQIKRTLKGQNNSLPTEEELMSLNIEDSVAWIHDQITTSALQISIVGNIPESVDVGMLTSTLGALPQRSSFSSETQAIDLSLTSFNFPVAPRSFVFSYDSVFGSLQASASVAWEMPAFTEETVDEIVGLFILERIFEDRIRVELREETGKVYGYSARLRTNDAYNNGEFIALCLVEVDNINEVGAKLLQIAKNLSEIGISDDELVRRHDVIYDYHVIIFVTNLSFPSFRSFVPWNLSWLRKRQINFRIPTG
jgi:zinc protease